MLYLYRSINATKGGDAMNIDKLRGVLAEKRITQKILANALGLTTKSVNAKLNGHSPITVDEANKIAKIAQIENPNEIFF